MRGGVVVQGMGALHCSYEARRVQARVRTEGGGRGNGRGGCGGHVVFGPSGLRTVRSDGYRHLGSQAHGTTLQLPKCRPPATLDLSAPEFCHPYYVACGAARAEL